MITLKQIRDNKPCEGSWAKLLKSYDKTKADDTVVTCEYLLKTLDVDDTLWVIFNCIDGKRVKKRHMVADIVERVLHIWENWAKDNAPQDLDAPRKAVSAIRSGKVNDEILRAAGYAWDAAYDAAADEAAEAAEAAYNACWGGNADYARDAALAAADAAGDAAADAAYAAGNDAEREEQEKIILTHFGE